MSEFEVPKCSLCRRERRLDGMDAYDYSPMQMLTGQPLGWYSGDDGPITHVGLVTDLSITGKVAQFGRGVLGEVSGKLLDQFVQNVEATVLSGGDADASDDEVAGELDRLEVVESIEVEVVEVVDADTGEVVAEAVEVTDTIDLVDTETGEVIEPVAESDPDADRRRKMTTALLLGFKRVGIEDRAERLYWTAVVVGRRDGLTSTNDLSLPELRAALSHVERVKDRDALEALGAVLEAEREGLGDA